MSLFGTKKKELALREIPTLISKGCTLSGSMKATSLVRIDGILTGDLTADEGAIIGEDGYVHGNVYTKELVIYGVVNGNATAEFVEIKSTGKLKGDVNTRQLIVESGGVYNGAMAMNGNAQPAF